MDTAGGRNARLLAHIKVLGMVDVGDKLVTRAQNMSIDPPSALTWFFRWKNDESSRHAIEAVNGVISQALVEMERLQRCDDVMHVALYVEELVKATRGLDNMVVTYNRRPDIMAQLQVTLQRVNRCITAANAWIQTQHDNAVPAPPRMAGRVVPAAPESAVESEPDSENDSESETE